MPVGTRVCSVALIAATTVVMFAAAAFAHSEFEPESAGAGTVVAVQLSMENERSDAGTVKVQLQFPADQPVTLAALPPAPGWTTSVQGGTVGAPVTGVMWSRATAEPENVTLPITLGPLPEGPARLQFKVLQTYSNGEIDRWIQDWPAGSSEPDMPGPVFQVTGGSTSTSTVPSTAASSTAAPSTAAPTTVAGSAAEPESDDDSDLVIPIVIAIIVVLGAGTAYLLRRRRAL